MKFRFRVGSRTITIEAEHLKAARAELVRRGAVDLPLRPLQCCRNSCCEKPAPGSLAESLHERDIEPSAEDFWSSECWHCGYVCRCEV